MRRAIDFSKHKRKGSSIFLSTPSARRATYSDKGISRIDEKFLSTPSARRATSASASVGGSYLISIHALREEGDQLRSSRCCRPPPISIHALREEGDIQQGAVCVHLFRFLSTPSARRATEPPARRTGMLRIFLSTPSARRATRGGNLDRLCVVISIHALREEGDPLRVYSPDGRFDFYPRPPRGGRRGGRRGNPLPESISIHALREEGDRRRASRLRRGNYFYPRPPRGGRRPTRTTTSAAIGFLSTPSARRATQLHAEGTESTGNFYPRPPRGGRRCCLGTAE